MLKASGFSPMHINPANMLLLASAVLSTSVDITGVDRPVLFAKLYRKALSLRSHRSIFSPSARKVNAKWAREYIGKYVHTLNGVEMNMCVPSEKDGDCLDTGGYNAMYGEGVAEGVVAKVRSSSWSKERCRAQSPCSGCSGSRCTDTYNNLTVNRFPCAQQIFCVSCSAVGVCAGYLACGAFGAFSTLCCCSVCGFITAVVCNNCYYNERSIREIIEANVPDACASHTA